MPRLGPTHISSPKITYSDNSAKYMMAIEGKGEIRLQAKQFKELKKMNCFLIAETDFSKKQTVTS